VSIDWDEIRRRGEEGMLTGDETDALVTMAREGARLYILVDRCLRCGSLARLTELQHEDDRPIAASEAASE